MVIEAVEGFGRGARYLGGFVLHRRDAILVWASLRGSAATARPGFADRVLGDRLARRAVLEGRVLDSPDAAITGGMLISGRFTDADPDSVGHLLLVSGDHRACSSCFV
jgi:hypothetical protein